jgi:hypothetical protein
VQASVQLRHVTTRAGLKQPAHNHTTSRKSKLGTTGLLPRWTVIRVTTLQRCQRVQSEQAKTRKGKKNQTVKEVVHQQGTASAHTQNNLIPQPQQVTTPATSCKDQIEGQENRDHKHTQRNTDGKNVQKRTQQKASVPSSGTKAFQEHKAQAYSQGTATKTNQNQLGPQKTRKSTSHKQLQLQQATASECSDKSDTSLREKRRRNFYTVLNEAITPLTLRCARCSQGKDYKMHLQQRQDARNGT